MEDTMINAKEAEKLANKGIAHYKNKLNIGQVEDLIKSTAMSGLYSVKGILIDTETANEFQDNGFGVMRGEGNHFTILW